MSVEKPCVCGFLWVFFGAKPLILLQRTSFEDRGAHQ